MTISRMTKYSITDRASYEWTITPTIPLLKMGKRMKSEAQNSIEFHTPLGDPNTKAALHTYMCD